MCKNLASETERHEVDARNAALLMNIVALYENGQAPTYWTQAAH